MPRSGSLRLSDIRGVFRLLNEIQVLAERGEAWQPHMLHSLCGMIGARQGTCLRWDGFEADSRLKLLAFHHGGWAAPEAAEMWAAVLRVGDFEGDPLLNRARRIPGAVRTMRWDQMISRREWVQSIGYNEFARMGQHDHPLIAWQHQQGRGRVLGIALHKAWGETNFSERDRNRLHLFNVELYRLTREGKMRPAQLDQPRLSPRQRQILDRLLAGDSVKQAAARLGISHRTAEDYVKSVYRIYGVHSRNELMSQFMRPTYAISSPRGSIQ